MSLLKYILLILSFSISKSMIKHAQVTSVIKNVWITGIDYTYQANDWVITDNMTWEAETIYSHLGAGGPAAVGGQDQSTYPFSFTSPGTPDPNWIEAQTDTGSNGRRGSLDAAGLIDLGGSAYGSGIY